MEKPISVTTFLHDIGLFVEKYLSASSIKVCASLQAELAHTLMQCSVGVYAGYGA